MAEFQPPEGLRLAVRRALAVVTPSRLSRCLHCFMPWGEGDRDGHTVMYSETSGLMVVCEFCWPLTTVEERVEYARQWVLTIWKDDSEWPQIERAYRASDSVQSVEPRGLSERDIDALARVGRMYLDALDSDPEHERLSATEALMVTEVREAVEKWGQR